MHFKKYILIALFSAAIFFGFTQQNISVPLDDPVYNMIDYALLRNYCENLPNARPYMLKMVLNVLRQIQNNPASSMREKVLAQETFERLQSQPASGTPNSILKNGSYTW